MEKKKLLIFLSIVLLGVVVWRFGWPLLKKTSSDTGTSEPVISDTLPVGDGQVYPIVNEIIPYDEALYQQDFDFDGLSNTREQELGTNMNLSDSDNDGLEDGAELEWQSDPLKADSDGDGFSDGSEVLQGYSPVGSGKIVQ